jgi:hypothetical protein
VASSVCEIIYCGEQESVVPKLEVGRRGELMHCDPRLYSEYVDVIKDVWVRCVCDLTSWSINPGAGIRQSV